jgi:hypothetical protein
MTKSRDRITKAQHMALCDLATPFLFHIEDPEPRYTQHDLMLPDPHQSEALRASSYLLLSAYRNSSTYQIDTYLLSYASIIDTMWYNAS